MNVQRSYKVCLVVQLVWIGLAFALNLYSMFRITNDQTPLTSTDPLGGIFVFSVYTLIWILGWLRFYRIYITGTVLFLTMIISGGIFKHLLALGDTGALEAYSSTAALLLAVAVNVFGTIASLIALRYALLAKTDSLENCS